MLKLSKPSKTQLEQDLELLDMNPGTDQDFRALDHIKYTKKVTKSLELWVKLNKIQRQINGINRINHGLPPHKTEKYNKILTNLTIDQFNARSKFNTNYRKLNKADQIEFALRSNELTKVKNA